MSDQEEYPTGFKVLNSASLNKGTAFTKQERDKYKLHGLLPPRINSAEAQLARALQNMRRKYYDIERYVFLKSLQGRNERLFYQLLLNNIEEVMPLIYTPTVGQACKEFGRLFRRPRGMYLSIDQKGQIKEVMQNWPYKNIKVIVVTDGERILGLGDLGANGMGISIGKLALYVACGGIHPDQCLPVMLDVGTNNQEYLDDDLYLGLHQKRVRGDEYYNFVDEFVTSANELFPGVLIQFEDFLTPRAYALMHRYKDRVLSFNDDIQGTAGVALSGVYASTRISNIDFADLRIMFLGAGSAATGIADLICYALQKEGLSEQQARGRCWFVDRQGLLVKSRDSDGVRDHNKPYLQSAPAMSLIEAIDYYQPHILIGATGSAGSFSEQVIKKMSAINSRPTIFALSNPTSHAECTAEQAYRWSDGRAIFASGSPFDDVEFNDQIFKPGQGNNAYVFPGIGLAAVMCQAKYINDDMFLVAAKSLAAQVSEIDLKQGALYPALDNIRELSINIAKDVIDYSYDNNIAQLYPKPQDIMGALKDYMYDPSY